MPKQYTAAEIRGQIKAKLARKKLRASLKCHDDLILRMTEKDWRRFDESCVQQDNGCILFRPDSLASRSYGHFSICGINFGAHRLALARHTGLPASNKFACHRCRAKNCVAVQHLYWGTAADNNADTSRDNPGRPASPRAQNHFRAQLRNADVLEIWRKYWHEEHAARCLAEAFGVSEKTIRQIIYQEYWLEVTGHLIRPSGVRKHRKGNQRKPMVVLSQKQRECVIGMLHNRQASHQEIAKRFDISLSTIRKIKLKGLPTATRKQKEGVHNESQS